MKQKIKNFSHKKCCLNCDGFCYWDGDYCCIKEMSIHQYGNGSEQMTFDIDNTMQTPETCKKYKYAHHKTYPENANPYIKEYKKFKEWERLCKQLEDHVSDKSGLYKYYKQLYLKF